MPIRLFAVLTLALLPKLATADPALAGTWSGDIEGHPLIVQFDGAGGGQVDGRPIRYQVSGGVLLVEDQGVVTGYRFQMRGAQLQVAGGLFPGMVTLTRGTDAAAAATGSRARTGPAPEGLAGKWCKSSSFTANTGGGSQSTACFELRADGSYIYGSERSASAYGGGMYGGTSGSGGDAGRWSATASTITAHSQTGRATTYQLERRNHPKNRDPMLCLDGECYVTYFRRAPW